MPDTTPSARRDWRVLVGIPAFYLLLAVALTWPTVQTFTTRIAGDYGDTFQNLWNFWWMKYAVTHFQSPFFTDHLRYPTGVTLVFQTMDWPDAVASLPLWIVLPPLGVYNAVVLWSFVLTGLGMYALVHDATGNRPAAIFAGAAFMAVPFHMAHALGHQHLVALGYLPLYLMFLHRIVKGGTLRDAALGGLALAAAALCSWYQLLFAFIWSLGVFGWAAWSHREAFLSKAFVKRAFTLAGAFLVVAGPLMLAMYLKGRGEPIAGSHDAHWFSADVESFFFPGGRMAWSAESQRFGHWTGNFSENGNYLGYALLLLGAVGLWKRPLARAYGATGLVGALLSMGPALHVAGQQSHNGQMPYAWLVKLIPGLDFSGVPVRFGLLAQGSLVVMAALGLAALLEHRKEAVQWGAPAAALAVVLVELWPVPLPTSVWDVPAPMLEWAKSPEDFSVVDFTGDTRMLWNAIHHGKKCVGGYVTRIPVSVEKWWSEHPVLGRLDRPAKHPTLRFERDDPRIAFNWGFGPPEPGMGADFFTVHWDGAVEAPREGEYTFSSISDDGASIAVDGKQLVSASDTATGQWRSGKVHLSAGLHQVAVDFHENTGGAMVQVAWEGPGIPKQLLEPASPGPGQPAAFHGRYSDGRPTLDMPMAQAQAALRALNLRYAVLGMGDRVKIDLLTREVGMRPYWQGGGILILELPPGPAPLGMAQAH